jgi:hypothetical protein
LRADVLELEAQPQVCPRVRISHALHPPHRADKIFVERLHCPDDAAGRTDCGVALVHFLGQNDAGAGDHADGKQANGDREHDQGSAGLVAQ